MKHTRPFWILVCGGFQAMCTREEQVRHNSTRRAARRLSLSKPARRRPIPMKKNPPSFTPVTRLRLLPGMDGSAPFGKLRERRSFVRASRQTARVSRNWRIGALRQAQGTPILCSRQSPGFVGIFKLDFRKGKFESDGISRPVFNPTYKDWDGSDF